MKGKDLQELLAIADTEQRKRRAVELATGKWLACLARAGKPPAPAIQPAEPNSLGQRLVAELEQATAENKNMQLQLDDRQLQLDQAQVQLQKADEEKERLAGELAKKERELIELQLARAVALGAFFPSQIRNFAAIAPPDLVAAQIAIERNY